MRISTLEHPKYTPLIQVYCNGVILPHCYLADEEQGYALCYVYENGQPKFVYPLQMEPYIETVRVEGEIRLEMPNDVRVILEGGIAQSERSAAWWAIPIN